MRHSEHTQNSDFSHMGIVGEHLKHDLLGLLLDGPSSFAALYGGLVRHCNYPPSLGVSAVTAALERMEEVEWVNAWQMAEDGSFPSGPTEDERKRDLAAYEEWLPTAQFEDLSLDEVGLWYEITAEGRAEWKRWYSPEERERGTRWMIDDSRVTNTIVVHAESAEVAEEAVRCWLKLYPGIELVSNSKRIEAVPSFKLRSGDVISYGIKLMYQYRITKSTSGE